MGERKSQQINKMYKFTFSSWAFQERVSVDESEISLPFFIRSILTRTSEKGHKSQTRLIFKNTYGDAFQSAYGRDDGSE